MRLPRVGIDISTHEWTRASLVGHVVVSHDMVGRYAVFLSQVRNQVRTVGKRLRREVPIIARDTARRAIELAFAQIDADRVAVITRDQLAIVFCADVVGGVFDGQELYNIGAIADKIVRRSLTLRASNRARSRVGIALRRYHACVVDDDPFNPLARVAATPFFDAAQTPPRQAVRYVDDRTFHHAHLEREGSGIIIERRRRGFGNLIRPLFGGAQIVRATTKGDTFAAADDKDVLQNA